MKVTQVTAYNLELTGEEYALVFAMFDHVVTPGTGKYGQVCKEMQGKLPRPSYDVQMTDIQIFN